MPPSSLPVSRIVRASTSTRSFRKRQTRCTSLLLFSTSNARALGRGVFFTNTSSCCSPHTATAAVPSFRSLGESFRGFSSTSTERVDENKAMASAAEEQPKCEWVVILPDKPGVLEKRVAVRESHLAAITTAYPSDFWLVAGALLERAPHDARNEAGAPLPMQGSAAVVWASSEEEVRKLLSGDVYAREGVWDMERLQCWAFKSALRR